MRPISAPGMKRRDRNRRGSISGYGALEPWLETAVQTGYDKSQSPFF